MLLFLSMTGIILSLILLGFNARKYPSAIYLSGFFFTLSFQVLNLYVLIYSKSVFLLSVFLINFTFLFYLVGPFFYLYIRSTLTDNPRLKKTDLWHLIPSVVFLITSFQYMFTPYSYKLKVATEFVENVDSLINYEPTVLYQILSPDAIFLSQPLFVLGYTLLSGGLIIRYLIQRKKISVLFGQRYMTTWLSILVGSLFILALSHLLALKNIFTAENATLFYTLNALQVLSGIGLSGLLISPFLFPDILYGLPRFPQIILEQQHKEGGIDLLHRADKKQSFHFESEYLLYIEKKTESCMMEFQPYLQPECNIVQFSVISGIPAHHLVYYFREIKKQPFHEFRNEFRIKYAKKLIKDGKASELTLESIGILSGFSSRNTFFIAFKKAEGISPGAFVNISSKNPQKVI